MLEIENCGAKKTLRCNARCLRRNHQLFSASLALLLAAQLAGKMIHVTGMNTCVRWSDGEDADTIVLSTSE